MRNLTKTYGNVTAVQDVSFSLEEGKIYGLLGRNGAGKTTIMHMITSQLFPTSGELKVFGEGPYENDRVLFVFIPEIVILFGMMVSVVLSTILIILVTTHAPQLFHTQDVGSQMFITGVVFMALSTIFASIGLRQGTIGDLTS